MNYKKKKRLPREFTGGNPTPESMGMHSMPVHIYDEGGSVKPIIVNDPNDSRLKAYQDSLDIYKQSLKIPRNYFNQPKVTKEEFDKSLKKSMSFPHYDFDDEGYKADKKVGKAKGFEDYVYDMNLPTKRDSIAYERNVARHYEKEGKEIVLPNGDKKYYPIVYKGKPDTSFYILTDGVTGTERTFGENKRLVGIRTPKIAPIETEYFTDGKVKKSGSINLTSKSTGWYGEEEKPVFKQTSSKSFDNYTIDQSTYDKYKKPIQPILYQAKQESKPRKPIINKPAKDIIDKLFSTPQPLNYPVVKGGQDFPPVDQIMGPAGQQLYRRDYTSEVWDRMAPPRKEIKFADGGTIPQDNTYVSPQNLQNGTSINNSKQLWFNQYPRQMGRMETFKQVVDPALQFGFSSASLPGLPATNIYQQEFTNKMQNMTPRNYTHTPNKWLHQPNERIYKKGGRIKCYDGGGPVGPTLEDGSFYTNGTGTGMSAGQIAGYANMALPATQAFMGNKNEPLSEKDLRGKQISSMVDQGISYIPGYGQFHALATAGSNIVRSNSGSGTVDALATPVHEKAITNASNGRWGDAALNLLTGGLNDKKMWAGYGGAVPSSPTFMTGNGTTYKDPHTATSFGMNPFMAEGGPIRNKRIINMERELIVNPTTRGIEVDLTGNKRFPHHPEVGMNSKGDMVANEGSVVITEKLSKRFKQYPKDMQNRIINNMIISGEMRDAKEAKQFAKMGGKVRPYGWGGGVRNNAEHWVVPNSFDPAMATTPEEQSMIASMTGNRYSYPIPQVTNPNYVAPRPMVYNYNAVGPRMEDGAFSTQGQYGTTSIPQARSTDWRGMAESAIPYIGSAAQMANAIFSKPQYGERLRNKEYGNTLQLMKDRRYNNRDEIRDINSGYNSAKHSVRDLSGGSTGVYLSALGNLTSNRSKDISTSYANKSNMDNQYLGQEAEARMRLGAEDAQYQGLYDQDRLMAQAARRKNIYAPMQNIGETYMMDQAYRRAYPKYR